VRCEATQIVYDHLVRDMRETILFWMELHGQEQLRLQNARDISLVVSGEAYIAVQCNLLRHPMLAVMSMNMYAMAGASIVLLQDHRCTLIVMSWTKVTMLLWPFTKIGWSVRKLMPIRCICPFTIASGDRRPIGSPFQWLV